MDHYEIQSILHSKLGKISSWQPVGSGSINETYKLSAGGASYFCKLNSATKFPQLFEKEAAGLERLRRPGIKTPEVVLQFETNGRQGLVMEWIERGTMTASFWEKAGEDLAALHRNTNDLFGLDHDNYMGAVPQSNDPCENWIEFFINRRLQPLINRCRSNGSEDGQLTKAFDKLYQRLPSIYSNSPPALLHGDLWNGNIMCDENNEPVFIDPAVYYGHPSIDIGMTALFGGFAKPFYEAYYSHVKRDHNFEEQCEVSNLYPLLIHLFLFGSSYKAAIERTLRKYS